MTLIAALEGSFLSFRPWKPSISAACSDILLLHHDEGWRTSPTCLPWQGGLHNVGCGRWFRQTLRAASVLQHMEEICAIPKSFGRSDPKPNERAWSRRGGAWISPRLQKPSESHWSYSRAVLRPPQQPEEPIRTESSA